MSDYDTDFHVWRQAQAAALRAKDMAALQTAPQYPGSSSLLVMKSRFSHLKPRHEFIDTGGEFRRLT
jgi:hypothetical protein